MSLLPSVIVQVLGGGLGNQLFDYSAARSLADRYAGSLVLDSSTLIGSGTPEFLPAFDIRARFRKLPGVESGIVGRVRRRIAEDLDAVRIVRAKGEYGYMQDWHRLPRRCQIRGNLISPRFFRDNEERIRSDLRLIDRAVHESRRFQRWAARMQETDNSIGVHVRRGDLLLPANQWILLPEIHRYTREAVEYIAQRVAQPRVFVFSDDPEWCQAEPRLGLRDYEVVSVPMQSREVTVTDFSLMQLCRHIVMPNSSFSWWAAYLRQNAGLTVLPKVWDPAGVISTEEMTMPGWIRL